MSIWEDPPETTSPSRGRGSVWEAEPAVAEGPPVPTIGYGEDIAKGAAGGLGRGVAGTLGLPGTVGGLVHSGLSKLGVPEDYINKAATVTGAAIPQLKMFRGPDAGDVQTALENYTGPLYQPQTIPGKYASTIAEFAPGMLVPGGGAGSTAARIGGKVLNTVVPAVTSETAGQLTEGTPYEPWARGVAGVAGGLAGAKAITPMRAPGGQYGRDVETLEAAGVPLTAGQRTGSKSLQFMESNAIDLPGAGSSPQAIQDAAREGLDRAVTQRVYGSHLPADARLPTASAEGQQALKDEYNRLSQFGMRSSANMQNRMTRAVDEYERLVLPHERSPNVSATRNDIVNRLVAQQGRMAGDEYQSIRSQIGKAAKGSTNTAEAAALRDIQGAMDEAMRSGLPPAEARAWALNNRRYALQKAVEPAVAKAADTGNISPVGLAQAVKSRRGAQYAAQSGDLDELAQAAARVMKPLPNSGTAARTAAMNFGAGGAGGGTIGAILGSIFPGLGTVAGGIAGTAIGGALPVATSRAITSKLGQSYLGNRALPQDARDILAQTLVQQGASQPEGAARNEAELMDYKKKQALRRVMIDTPGYR